MTLRFANNVGSVTLATTLDAENTAIRVADGSRFPGVVPGDGFYVTLTDGTNHEVCLCVAHAKSADTLSVVRGVDADLPARDWPQGTRVEMRAPAELYEQFLAAGDDITGDWVIPGNLVLRGTVSLPGSPLAVSSGGTGVNTLAANRVLLGAGTGALSPLASTSGILGAEPNASAWSQVDPNTILTSAAINEALSIEPLEVQYGGLGATDLGGKTGLLLGNGAGRVQVLEPVIVDDTSGVLNYVGTKDGKIGVYATQPARSRGFKRFTVPASVGNDNANCYSRKYTLVLPDDVTYIWVTLQAGGGGGCGSWHHGGQSAAWFGHGGGAGRFLYRKPSSLKSGGTITVVVGGAGYGTTADEVNRGVFPSDSTGLFGAPRTNLCRGGDSSIEFFDAAGNAQHEAFTATGGTYGHYLTANTVTVGGPGKWIPRDAGYTHTMRPWSVLNISGALAKGYQQTTGAVFGGSAGGFGGFGSYGRRSLDEDASAPIDSGGGGGGEISAVSNTNYRGYNGGSGFVIIEWGLDVL